MSLSRIAKHMCIFFFPEPAPYKMQPSLQNILFLYAYYTLFFIKSIQLFSQKEIKIIDNAEQILFHTLHLVSSEKTVPQMKQIFSPDAQNPAAEP